MAVIIVLLLLASGILADPLPQQSSQNGSEIGNVSASGVTKAPLPMNHKRNEKDIADEVMPAELAEQHTLESKTSSLVCEYPFISVGENCLFYSDVQMSFSEAEAYCETLGFGHNHNVTLAVLGSDNDNDQALLDEAASRDSDYWVGGWTENNVNWKWVTGDDVDLESPFWYYLEPNVQSNQCIASKVYESSGNNIKRSYLYDSNCAEYKYFICQASLCPLNFRKVNNACYFISEEIGLPHVHWQQARDFCMGLAVPEGYQSDLAVFDTSDQLSFHLMNDLMSFIPYGYAWIGLYEDSDCDFKWVDERSQSTQSNFWYPTEPSCGSEHHVRLELGNNKPFMVSVTGDTNPFLCQMYAN